MSRRREDADERECRRARREAREGGYEYRPTTFAQSLEARRLNAGFEQMVTMECDVDDESEEDEPAVIGGVANTVPMRRTDDIDAEDE